MKKIDVSAFSFCIDDLQPDAISDRIVVVPASLHNREALFDVLRRQLMFPGYFGGNWDALSECFRDLSWINERRVVLLHDDLPLWDREAGRVYLEILADAVRDWTSDEEHELLVVFPAFAKSLITTENEAVGIHS